MKFFIIPALFLSAYSFGQIQTTTGSGNFFNPLLWDCFCVPANGDSLVVNHDMELTASIYYNSGQIKVNASGSLTEDGTDRDVWIDGTGSLINNGTFDCYRLYVSDGSFVNTSTSVYFDSLWNQGNISNTGLMTVYDVLNDETGVFTNSGQFIVDNNFYNSGDYLNTGSIDLVNNFANCNIQTMDAMFINDGVVCVGNDLSNCLDDTISGTGAFYVAGDGSNFGVFDGTFDYNTPSGALAITGTVDPGITFGTAPCYLGQDNLSETLSLYPNPASNTLFVTAANFNYRITDVSGKIWLNGLTETGEIDITSLATGLYTLTVINEVGQITHYKFVKR